MTNNRFNRLDILEGEIKKQKFQDTIWVTGSGEPYLKPSKNLLNLWKQRTEILKELEA